MTLSVLSTIQYLRVLKSLKKEEVPEGYWLRLGVVTNIVLSVLGLLVTFYLLTELK